MKPKVKEDDMDAILQVAECLTRAERVIDTLVFVGAEPKRAKLMQGRLRNVSEELDKLSDALFALRLRKDLSERMERDGK